jgi:hypothetical protein
MRRAANERTPVRRDPQSLAAHEPRRAAGLTHSQQGAVASLFISPLEALDADVERASCESGHQSAGPGRTTTFRSSPSARTLPKQRHARADNSPRCSDLDRRARDAGIGPRSDATLGSLRGSGRARPHLLL